jgi:SNF2 family DNA or RNA helicase
VFKGELFESQKEGAQFLCAKKYALLAWEQGTGKTIIAIAAAEKLLELGLIKDVLIIAPSAIAWQWQEKIESFTDTKVTLLHAKSKERKTYATGTPYTVTSYNLFRRDFDTIKSKRWDVIICDEAQEFKNNKSQTAKLLKQYSALSNPAYRWALTGTVISNRLEELYSIMYWVDRRFFPAWPTFEERHVVRNPQTNQILRYKNLKSLSAELPKRLNRKTQAEVGGMPDLLHDFLYVEKTKELIEAEKILLDALDDMAEVNINSTGDLSVAYSSDVSRAFSEVKQLLAQPNKLLLTKGQIQDILAENPSNRVVVFSHYKQPLKDMRELLDSSGIASYPFTGDQKSTEKQESITNFKANPSVLLASDAGKAGLDLPFANYLFHIDIPFSFEVLDQRNKRITRASSDFTSVKANYLVVKNSFEEYYYRVVKAKERLSEAVYKGNTDEVTMKTGSLRKFLDDKLR